MLEMSWRGMYIQNGSEGKNALGRRFMMVKLRTMKVYAETVSHENHLEGRMQANCAMTKRRKCIERTNGVASGCGL
jgi:hypothetical protein